MDKPYAEIGKRLKLARKTIGGSQEAFAAAAGLNKTQYQNWESGTSRISIDGALALRRTYGLSLDFIYEGNVAALPSNLASAFRDSPRDSHSR